MANLLKGIRYTIAWRALLKTKRIGIDTEQDIDLAPEAFWETTLHKKVTDSLERGFSPRERPEPTDTVIVVSVSKRAERDLTKQFVGFDIDWAVIKDKLVSWACHFHVGERLTLKVLFRFRPGTAASQTSNRAKGRRSTTRRLRRGQALRRDAKEHATGEAACWRTVYRIMRCPGRPCPNSAQYCFRDQSGKHFKLLTAHMRQLVAYMLQGNKFETQSDVPIFIREQLYAEADKRTAGRRTAASSPLAIPQHQMHMATPAATPRPSNGSPGHMLPSSTPAGQSTLERLDIPAPYEDAIHDYVQWQQGQSRSEEWMAHFAKAGDVLTKQGYKLGLFYQRQLIGLLTRHSILEGIALSFHNDIPEWLSGYRQRSAE